MTWTDSRESYCRRIRSYIDSCPNGELIAEANPDLADHLEDCPECASYLQIALQQKARLKEAVLGQEIPIALEPRIREALGTRSPDMHRWMLAAAAIIIVAVGTWTAVRLSKRTAESKPGGSGLALTAPSADDARILEIGMGEHVHCALDLGFADKEFSDEAMSEGLGPDYAGLVPLVRDRIPPGMVVTAAHRCRYNDRRFVHLILRDGQAVLSLLITRKDGESFSPDSHSRLLDSSGATLRLAGRQDMHVAGFETGSYLIFVVSNQTEADNTQLASNLAPVLSDFLHRTQA